MSEHAQPSSKQVVQQAVKKFAKEPELSGSAEGEFTFVLANQVAGALFTGTGTSREMAAVMQQAAFGAMRGVAPVDPLEGMFAAQMVTVHNTAMDCFRRAALPEQSFEGRRMALEFANKLVRSYAALAEALSRYRSKGQQTVRVEHVHVHPGGQAIVGAVIQEEGVRKESEDRSHAPRSIAHEPQPEMRGADARRQPLPVAGGVG